MPQGQKRFRTVRVTFNIIADGPVSLKLAQIYLYKSFAALSFDI